MFVLGTAGHVDHGKSTLLRALTGMEPDRLPEEKRRGMTIDLNFVWWQSSLGKIGIVDVPGHEKFVKNLVHGIQAIDAFIFVVAADDGWMPQSEEHFQLLRGLGITNGVVVLSKIDRVETAMAAERRRELETKWEGRVPVVPFAPNQPATLEKVKTALEGMLAHLPRPRPDGVARLWIDRVFSPHGQGVVVTGTLREGSLQVGEEIRLMPGGLATIKTIQSYGDTVTAIAPNRRTALQLSRVGGEVVRRGQLVTTNRSLPATSVIDVRVTPLFGWEPKRATEVRLHVGTGQTTATWFGWGASESGLWGRLRFKEKLPLRFGERVILRTSGEERTIGCAEVIDPAAEKIAVKVAKGGFLTGALIPDNGLSYFLKTRGAIESDDLSLWPESVESLRQRLRPLTLNIDDKLWVEKGWVARLRQTPADLKKLSWTEAGKTLWERERKAVAAGPSLAEQGAENALRRQVGAGKGTPVVVKGLASPAEKAALQRLVQSGALIRLPEDHFLTAPDYQNYAEQVTAYLRQKKQATSSELREHLGLSRKYVIWVLERLDADRLTYLKDGLRRLLK